MSAGKRITGCIPNYTPVMAKYVCEECGEELRAEEVEDLVEKVHDHAHTHGRHMMPGQIKRKIED
ncbi:MAG: hypothetical protein ABEJ69_03565 [Candidatus Nanohaloarchaea archaeon]